MAVSNSLASVLEQVADLEKKLTGLESRCDALEGQHQVLTEELGKARLLIQELVKELNRERKPAKKLQELSKDDNRVGVDKVNGAWRRSPLEIFPAEIWTMILDQIREPKDLKSCYKAHPDFQPMLEKQRTTFLFDDVVKLLASNVEGFGRTRWSKGLTKWTSENPLINCRLVCHHWKQAVDQFLQQESASFTSIPEANFVMPAFRMVFAIAPYGDGGFEYEQDRINTALSFSRIPVPSRYILYNNNNDEEWYNNYEYSVDFTQALTRFLMRFGRDVRTMRMNLEGRRSGWNEAYGYIPLVNQLSATPNLNELYISNAFCKWWGMEQRLFTSECSAKDNEPSDYDGALMSSLQRPFPCLPKLKRIVFEECHPQLVKKVLQANNHVKQLRILAGHYNTCYDLENLQLVNLTQAHLSVNNAWKIPANWPLVKLTLDCSNLKDLSKLYEIGREPNGKSDVSFAKTLKELELSLYGPCNSYKNARLDLPALKSLKLKMSGCFYSIDFILPLVNLEYLEVDFCKMCEMEHCWKVAGFKPLTEIVEIIKIHGYVDNLKQSNVWTLLPKLKQVKARTDWNKEAKGKYPAYNPKWHLCHANDVKIY